MRSQSLSPKQARKLVLNSQRVLALPTSGNAIDATRAAIRHLGYIQIDTISVVARAHHHTLWNRNPRYQPQQLDALLAARKVFEYWSHAAAYLPIEEYRFALPRMQQAASADGHWHKRDSRLIKQILQRIIAQGAVMARDFEDSRSGKTAMWQRKPAKYALEQLFMEGRLMITKRIGFNKVYDLRERVLPDDVDCRMPDQLEYATHLITAFLRAHGLGQIAEFGYLRKGLKPIIAEAAQAMLEQGALQKVMVAKQPWLMLANAEAMLKQPLARSKARILSPFDNMIIQRKRIRQLFNFDYQIECYVPAGKRQYGYFVLPIIWGGTLVARVDCKAHRAERLLEIRNLALEPDMGALEKFSAALAQELVAFAAFNECQTIKIGKVAAKSFAALLRQSVSNCLSA